LRTTQTALTQYAVLKIAPDLTEGISGENGFNSGKLTRNELDEQASSFDTKKIWGAWAKKEYAFYAACFRVVQKLNRSKFRSIAGISGELALRNLLKRREALSNRRLPAHLVLNPEVRILFDDEDKITVVGYSALNPIRLPRDCHIPLTRFDGKKSTRDVLKEIRTLDRIDMDRRLLLELWRFRILIE